MTIELSENAKLALSVVIINYRTAKLVTDCLETLLPEVYELDAKVVIVDNNSADDSPDIIQTWLDENDSDNKVLFIRSDTNGGFSAGNNIGINAIAAEYYLLLNSDTLIRKGALALLLETATKYPTAGLFSPRLEWKDGKPQESCFRFISPLSALIASANTGLVTSLLKEHDVPIPVTAQISFPDWTSFACVMVRDKVFEEIGLMDDEFFMYFEDAEFSYRANQHGWGVVNNPAARVVHLRGGSSPVKENTKLGKRLPRYYYESRTRYYYKVYGHSGLFLANTLWWFGRGLSKLRELFGRKVRNTCEKQWRDIWVNCLKPQREYTRP